jgi:hypothetical protein
MILRRGCSRIGYSTGRQACIECVECCDSCIENGLASLQDIRSHLVDKQVDLSELSDGGLYLILDLMLEGIRQFFTFEENLRTSIEQFPGELRTRLHRQELQPYFAALEMLRGHLYRCLSQVAVIAGVEIHNISAHIRYESAWQIEAYESLDLQKEASTR